MGYLDYTDDFIFFPRQENSQEYFNICDFKSLLKRTDTICHCFNHDRQLFYKDIFYFDPVEHFWFCGVCPHFYPTGLASCVEIPVYFDLTDRIFFFEMAKYNLTTEDYENLAADTKAALLRYIEGDGDSDQYDTEEETEMVKNLSEEEKKLYDEYRDVYIKQLVEMGRVADLSADLSAERYVQQFQ